jgi:prepilin-type processing-associated H-X9-DG protein
MNHSPLCRFTDHAADSMFFLSKSRLFPVLPIKFPGYPFSSAINIGYVDGHSRKTPLQKLKAVYRHAG